MLYPRNIFIITIVTPIPMKTEPKISLNNFQQPARNLILVYHM